MTTAYAFFDVDGTLLRIKSMFSFHDFWYRRWKGLYDETTIEEYRDVTAILRALAESDAPRELINRRYYEFFAGRQVDEVTRCAQAWGRCALSDPNLFISEVVDELNALRSRGVEPVFVSGSFREILEPVAERLGVEQMLAIRLVQSGGRYTGRFDAPQTIGQGKALAIHQFLAERQVKPADCWAFGDDGSDLPMLAAVGHPVAVIGDPALHELARDRGWRCMHLNAADDHSLIRSSLTALVGATM
ncbi:HAD family phosphatase [Ideonella sp. DXS29W]|uniref:HAD family phosphatase n=1 Tax=Ideonella lacteola TaxID=2984193 RepID=A0ABU9BXP7_9BURK